MKQISFDGERLATTGGSPLYIAVQAEVGTNVDVWLYAITSSSMTKLSEMCKKDGLPYILLE